MNTTVYLRVVQAQTKENNTMSLLVMQFTYNIYFGNGEQGGKITARNMIRREQWYENLSTKREGKKASIWDGKNAVRKAETEMKIFGWFWQLFREKKHNTVDLFLAIILLIWDKYKLTKLAGNTFLFCKSWRIILCMRFLLMFSRNLVLTVDIMKYGVIRKRTAETKIVRAYFKAVKQWEKELIRPVNSKK